MISTKSNPLSALGRIGFFDDFEYEKESNESSVVSAVAKGAGGIMEAFIGLGQDISGIEPKKELNGEKKFSLDGSIEFTKAKAQLEEQQKQKEVVDKKKIFFQALKEDTDRAQKAKDKLLFEEEINDIATNLPTDQKNELLHYQASYKDRSIYQRAELRKKLIEIRNKSEKKEKSTSVPSPTKQPSAMEGAFEGRSGAQGGGSANLSAQAVG